MRTLIRNGTVATASDAFKADVLIEGEKVALVGADLSKQEKIDRTIDASGKYVLPGGIDPHTHLDMPFGGTRSSDDRDRHARGGLGARLIIDSAIQPTGAAWPVWTSGTRKLRACKTTASTILRAVSAEALGEMDTLSRRKGCRHSLFTAYPGVFMVDDQQIFRLAVFQRERRPDLHARRERPVIDILVAQALERRRRPGTTR